jgi:hypothetical protein
MDSDNGFDLREESSTSEDDGELYGIVKLQNND